MVGAGGLEPPTSASSGQRSDRLSYAPDTYSIGSEGPTVNGRCTLAVGQ